MEILIVDDDDITRSILERMLRKLGYSCESAASGAKALEILRTNTAKLVYLDCNMPGLSGYETARRIRSIESCIGIPIVALTGIDETSAIYSAGMDDFLGKPLAMEDLKRMTEKWLGE